MSVTCWVEGGCGERWGGEGEVVELGGWGTGLDEYLGGGFIARSECSVAAACVSVIWVGSDCVSIAVVSSSVMLPRESSASWSFVGDEA